MKKLFFNILFLAAVTLNAQDNHFSMFYLNPLPASPANAGATKDIRAVLHFKDQWKSLDNGFRTYNLCLDARLGNKRNHKKSFMGAGLNVLSDQGGFSGIKTTRIEVPLAAHVRVDNDNIIGAGISGAFLQRTLNPENLTWGEQWNGTAYDGSLNSNENFERLNFSVMDFNAGMSWVYNHNDRTVADEFGIKNMFSVSINHLNRPRTSFYTNDPNEKMYMRYSVFESMQIDLKNSDITILPSILFAKQGPATEIVMGALFRYELQMESRITYINKGTAISIGADYRLRDAIIPVLFFEHSNYSIGMAYDFNISQLTPASRSKGGIEICLRFVNPSPFYKGGAKSRI